MARVPLVLIPTLLLLAGNPHGADAQFLRLKEGATIGADHQSSWSGNVGGPLNSTRRTGQSIRIPLTGMIVDRRLVAYDVALNFRHSTDTGSGLDETIGSSTFGWQTSLRLFSAAPISLGASTYRADGTTGGGTTALGTFTTSGFSADLRYTNAFLPITLVHLSRQSDNLWTTGQGKPLTREQGFRSTEIRASNRKLTLLYRTRLNETGADQKSILRTGWDMNHRIQWGKGSRLESSFRTVDQTGAINNEQAIWQEALLIEHTEDLRSNMSFMRSDAAADGTREARWAGSWSTNLRREGIGSAGLRGSMENSASTPGTESRRSIGPHANVTLSMPLGLSLQLEGSLRVERRDRTRTTDDHLPIIDEAHRLDASRTFFLERRLVDVESVAIQDQDGNRFLVELDYFLAPIGDETQVLIPPGSRIEPGTTLRVSYTFRLPFRPSDRAWSGSFGGGISRGPLRVRYSQGFRNAEADDVPLESESFFERRISSTLSSSTPWGRLDADVTFRSYQRFDRDARSVVIGVRGELPGTRNVRLFVGSTVQRSTTNDIATHLVSANARWSWSVSRALRFNGRVEWMDWFVNGVTSNRAVGLVLGGQASTGSTTLNLDLNTQFAVAPSTHRIGRFGIRLVRRIR